MKRLVLGLAIAGLLFVVAPAMLGAGEVEYDAQVAELPEAVDVDALEIALGSLPLAISASDVQLVDHCYRRAYSGYRGHYGHRSYSPYRGYGSPYGYTPRHYRSHGAYYRPPAATRYGYPPYAGRGFGIHIGF